jgi:hypothetical protein
MCCGSYRAPAGGAWTSRPMSRTLPPSGRLRRQPADGEREGRDAEDGEEVGKRAGEGEGARAEGIKGVDRSWTAG